MATVTAERAERRPVTVAREQQPQKPASWYTDRIIRYAVLIGLGIFLLGPFILAFLGSFKTDREILAYPPTILPTEWHPENWGRVWETEPTPGATFPRWVFNSAFLSVIHVITVVIFSSMAAYAFARLKFPGKNLIFSFMLATMMIPGAVSIVPAYVLMSKIGWINRYESLIVPGFVTAFGIFLLTQFFKAIPRELEEAAYIDGASRFQIYKDVILPLARPALLTLVILEFQGMWNAYLGPLLYLQDPTMFTMTVGMKFFQQQYKTAWNLILVGSMFNAIPVLILFFIFNKYYIEGISYAGLKG
jgi:ABC-type glycerol-3-phosphate transport system permease component